MSTNAENKPKYENKPKDENKPKFDERVGDVVDPVTGQVGPDDAPEWQTPEFDGNGTGWHRDGQPVAPFPEPEGGVGFKTDHFQAATVASALTEQELAAVQRANRGDAGLDDPSIIDAHNFRVGEHESIGEMTKAGNERRKEQEKEAAKKIAAEKAKTDPAF